MYLIFTTALAWFLRSILLKAVVFGIIFALAAALIPFVVEQIAPFIGTAGLTTAFIAIPSGVWYFLDMMRLDFGLPLLLSAFVARFIIRRIPIIG